MFGLIAVCLCYVRQSWSHGTQMQLLHGLALIVYAHTMISPVTALSEENALQDKRLPRSPRFRAAFSVLRRFLKKYNMYVQIVPVQIATG